MPKDIPMANPNAMTIKEPTKNPTKTPSCISLRLLDTQKSKPYSTPIIPPHKKPNLNPFLNF